MTNRVDGQSRRNVVGIDGSPGSRSALRRSTTPARLVDDRLRVRVPVLYEADTHAASAEKILGEPEVAAESREPVPGCRSETGAPS
jgi:hypothetical protein